MIKRVAVAVLVTIGFPAFATAQHSFTLFSSKKQYDAHVTVAPWYTYDGVVSFDTRYNFDEPKTWAGLIGKNIPLHKRGSTIIATTPYVGVLAGDTHGFTAQSVTTMNSGRVSLLLWEQYSWMARPTRDYHYTWLDAGVRTTDYLTLGIGTQQCTERGQPTFWDVGPFVKIVPISKTSARFWVTWDPQHSGKFKMFVGLGFTP